MAWSGWGRQLLGGCLCTRGKHGGIGILGMSICCDSISDRVPPEADSAPGKGGRGGPD